MNRNLISALVIVAVVGIIAASPPPTPVLNGGTGTSTAPSSGQIPIAQSSAAYAPKTINGDVTIASSGAATVNSAGGDPNFLFTDKTGQAFTGGIHPTAFSNGTGSGNSTITVDVGKGPIQTITNGGPFKIAMAAFDGSTVTRVCNNGSAGAITFQGFSEGTNTGDPLTTVNGSCFDISLTQIGGSKPHYLISALQ